MIWGGRLMGVNVFSFCGFKGKPCKVLGLLLHLNSGETNCHSSVQLIICIFIHGKSGKLLHCKDMHHCPLLVSETPLVCW